MKLKALGLATVAAMAFTTFAVSSASATTLEVGGVTKNEAVTFEWSLKAGTKTVLARTDGSLANECESSTGKGTTVSPFTGSTVTAVTSSLTYLFCIRGWSVHKAGVVHLAHIAGTTKATVTFSKTQWTVGSPFGTLNCETGEGATIGTLTGLASGEAELDVSAVLNCGFLVPSATWKSTYVFTSPKGLGVSA